MTGVTAAIKGRLSIIWSYVGWEDYLGLAILVLGVMGFILEPIMYQSRMTAFYIEIRSELVGIGITVLIIDNANEMIRRREEKKRLILQMGSPDNAFAQEAVRQLRFRGWLMDGSLRGASLLDANLQGAKLSYADMQGVTMVGANLQGAELWETNLNGADISNANMENAKMGKAKLQGANLWKTNLQGAVLVGAHLQKANLLGAILTDTDLQVAHLQDADLRGAKLQRANLTGTELLRVNLTGANLQDALVKPNQLDTALALDGASMPDGSMYDGRFDGKEEKADKRENDDD